jgi:DNA-directed RNA polymerase subunit RPC12/RpoP
MLNYKTVYKCHTCGTTSYKRIMERQASGGWLPTGAYQCTGCLMVFESLRAWRSGARSGANVQPASMQGA